MTRQLTAFLMTLSLFIMLALRVQAAPSLCMPAADLTAALTRQFGEYPLATALIGPGILMQVHVSATGTWTMTLIRPDGVACIGAAGRDFNLLHGDGLTPAKPT